MIIHISLWIPINRGQKTILTKAKCGESFHKMEKQESKECQKLRNQKRKTL